ncbi:MauE/DoxX family redox-associated membrane protein [Flavobacterium chungangensis]|uniref:MauE/DoxX family redox-associated membrane protein n=1 Tax=Flavobacterium chungangensis TaxID=2708132 RepID=A0ABV8ZJ11_9FLAO
MKLHINLNNTFVEVTCLLYVLLFVYASVSKILDFESFQVQLGQSPLLSIYAGWMSWLVISLEILISILLLFPKTRGIGLWASFNLMVMFTVYIFIILHYSSFVPCSCGGILEKMTWQMHLAFNIVFVLLALIAIIFKKETGTIFKCHKSAGIAVSAFLSIATVVVLYINSESEMHYNNPFTRRYIKTSIHYVASKDLKFNSYYFAGYSGSKIYFGNSVAPLSMLSIDTAFQKFEKIRIDFKDEGIPFKYVRIYIRGKYFYLGDGTVPRMFRGSTSSWKIDLEFKGIPSFTSAAIIDSTSFVFRNNTGENGSNIIGIYNADDSIKVKYSPYLLKKQIDGIFDTDGSLQYDEKSKKIIYAYFYRNEFLTADKNANLINTDHTIDTTTKANIKVAKLKGGDQRKMAAPPMMVNAGFSAYDNCLFMRSKIRGFYENEDLWENGGEVIDVYNLKKRSYVLSIPIFGSHNGRFKEFMVTGTHLYLIFGNTLMIYKFQNTLKKEIDNL